MSAGRAQPGSLYKLAILGDGGVGKTALSIQLCLNQFVETYDPTIEDSYRKRIVLDGQPTTLEVLDTAGQEEYTALRDQWIRDGEGFLLVYSITERNAFSRIKHYYNQILRVKDGEPFGAVLVGNKCDRTEDRAVSVPEGERLAKELNIPFYETSAKLNINAEKAFLTAARLTRDTRNAEFEGSQHYDEHHDANEQLAGAAIVPDSAPAAPAGTEGAVAADSTVSAASAAVSGIAAGAPAPAAATSAPPAAAIPQKDPQTKAQPNSASASSERPDSGSRRKKRKSKKCTVM
ncbi:Protein ras-2 [Wickerhamiella sorbophila]|uniref:Protein ras-2 n=1 Tax=Wickerhamiella sorbophila TaxID=45607 RepID=A0A2T0FEB5_9ASCO|nr:Protein ras-2 [Wickerhamiella sorbophila]PRT53324.1 Protein ras-2 [Wickerhamiella sorbophila]